MKYALAMARVLSLSLPRRRSNSINFSLLHFVSSLSPGVIVITDHCKSAAMACSIHVRLSKFRGVRLGNLGGDRLLDEKASTCERPRRSGPILLVVR